MKLLEDNSNKWEDSYSQGRGINQWPFSDLISISVSNIDFENSKALMRPLKVFEFGFGVGNNIPFWLKNNCDFHGVEFSAKAIQIARNRFPYLENNFIEEDLNRLSLDFESFDVMYDRAALTHNTNKDLRNFAKNLIKWLKPGGIFIGCDWFSKKHESFSQIDCTWVDDSTRDDFQSGQFRDLGIVHFIDEQLLKDIFTDFDFLEIREKTQLSFKNSTIFKNAQIDFAVRRP